MKFIRAPKELALRDLVPVALQPLLVEQRLGIGERHPAAPASAQRQLRKGVGHKSLVQQHRRLRMGRHRQRRRPLDKTRGGLGAA